MSWTRMVRGMVLACGLAATLAVLGCGKVVDPWPKNKRPHVLASFPPIACFAMNVAGDDVPVLSLLTATGPHDYQPTIDDTYKVRGADLFFINGLELDDHFATKIRNGSGNPTLPIIPLGETVKGLLAMGHDEKKDDKHAGHAHAHGEHDPHVWLGVPEAIQMVEAICEELKQKDPARAETYDTNADTYVERLKRLHDEGKSIVQAAKPEDRQLISFHESLGYFARGFGLKVVGVIETRPGIPPDIKEFNELVELCKAKNVRVVAREPQYEPASAQRLLDAAKRADLKLVPIDPLETAPDPAEFGKDWYEKKMRANLEQLRDAWK